MQCAKARPSLNVKVKRQRSRSPGTKNDKVRHFSGAILGARSSTPVGKSANAVYFYYIVFGGCLRQQHGLLIEKTVGSGRSFKVRGQEWGSEAVPSVESRGKPPDIVWEPWPQKLTTLFVKISYFVTVLRMTRRYLHSLPTNVQYEM